VCVSDELRLHAALVSAAKVMRCIQGSLVLIIATLERDSVCGQRPDGEEHPGNYSSHDYRLGRQRFLCQFKVGSGRVRQVQGHCVSVVLRIVHIAVLVGTR